ncbi:hypothetical protein B0T21DRAFT_296085 [Apiosordaria backusii]|uniref:F-box domain-containing protein n=1 Tax=Apiosordaria backusii TaxID=314023 RepID=A0AA40DUY7_9PEZI|nr:hypothetical protein B0T21DRAFT_296085 [Apiosordaria backusii]
MSELSPILRLSPELRQCIYLFTGVAPWRHEEKFIFDLHGPPHGEQADGNDVYPQFHGLLLSCRTIYQEVAALLYSSNSFIIYSATGPFDPLLALTSTALTSLGDLKIVVSSQTACHIKTRKGRSVEDCCLVSNDYCTKIHRNIHQPPLRSSDASSRALLDQWQSVAVHLSKITPDRLTLFLVCDVDHQDREAARLAVEPLALLPPLKECHVRIGEKPVLHLQQLARETVIKALGVPTSADSSSPSPIPVPFSRFLRLPRELRLRILSFTDLVTPIKEVSWDGGPYRVDRPVYSIPHEAGPNSDILVPCRRDHHHGCQFNQCWLRSYENHLVGCFCSVEHTAVSSTCRCWAPPIHLFLVCRSLYYEAQHVFFSVNRFIIHDFGDPTRSGATLALGQVSSYPNARLPVSRFLRDRLSASNLASLRFLEFTFPAYRLSAWPDANHPAIKDWINTVEYIKDRINGPSLTVRVVVADPPGYPPDGPMTVDRWQPIEAAYDDIISPLARLARDSTSNSAPLHRFYAHLAYPWWAHGMSSPDTVVYGGYDEILGLQRFIRWEEERMKEHAERMVLGDERYEETQRMMCRRVEQESDMPQVGPRNEKEESNDEDVDFDFWAEISDETLSKSLEDWDREQREGKEPPISHWLFRQMLIRGEPL